MISFYFQKENARESGKRITCNGTVLEYSRRWHSLFHYRDHICTYYNNKEENFQHRAVFCSLS